MKMLGFRVGPVGMQHRPFMSKPCFFPGPAVALVSCARAVCVSASVCVCWQTVRKKVICFQGSGQLTKNTLHRWRPLSEGGNVRKESSWRISRGTDWLAGLASFNRLVPMSLSFSTLHQSCSMEDDTEVCPLCVLCNSTSKRLIMELIRTHWEKHLIRPSLCPERHTNLHSCEGLGTEED